MSASQVITSPIAILHLGKAGETIIAGDILYEYSAGILKLARAGGTLAESRVVGMALHAAYTNQPIEYTSKDPGLVIDDGSSMTSVMVLDLPATYIVILGTYHHGDGICNFDP